MPWPLATLLRGTRVARLRVLQSVLPACASRLVRLVAPVVLPSWRFFDVIGPSPRLEIAIDRDGRVSWAEVQGRPSASDPWARSLALLHSPARNDALYVASCCERVLAGERGVPLAALRQRAWRAAVAWHGEDPRALRARIVVLERARPTWRRRVAFAFAVTDSVGVEEAHFVEFGDDGDRRTATL